MLSETYSKLFMEIGSSVLTEVNDTIYGNEILLKMYNQRNNQTYCDGFLRLNNKDYPIHKCILSVSCKNYEENLNYESTIQIIQVSSIINDFLTNFIQFLYTGNIVINCLNVLDLLHLSISFSINSLLNHCCLHLQKIINRNTCFAIQYLAKRYNLSSLNTEVECFIFNNVHQLMEENVILDLSLMQFEPLLCKMIPLKEPQKIKAIANWLGYKFNQREVFIVKLLKHISWNLVTSSEISVIFKVLDHSSIVYNFSLFKKEVLKLWSTFHKEKLPDNLFKISEELNISNNNDKNICKIIAVSNTSGIFNDNNLLTVTHSKSNQINSLNEKAENNLNFNESSSLQIPESEMNKNVVSNNEEIDSSFNISHNDKYESKSFNYDSKDNISLVSNDTVCYQDLPEIMEDTFENDNINNLTEIDKFDPEKCPLGKKLKSKNKIPFHSKLKNKFLNTDEFYQENPVNDENINQNNKTILGTDFNKKNLKKITKNNDNKKVIKDIKFLINDNRDIINDKKKKITKINDKIKSENKQDQKIKIIIENTLKNALIKNKINVKGKCNSNKKSIKNASLSQIKIKNNKFISETTSKDNKSRTKRCLIKCTLCPFTSKDPQKFKRHSQFAHSSKKSQQKYICDKCDFSCLWNRQYYQHLKMHYKGPPYKCDKCEFYTSTKLQLLLMHKMNHEEVKPFICMDCGTSFKTQFNLTTHSMTHTGEKPFKCNKCTSAFRTKGTLNQHMATHNPVKAYLCDLCAFSTKYQSHFKSHKRIHSGDLYKCQFGTCEYVTPKKSLLAQHQRIHLQLRSYVCSTCSKAFIEKSHLTRHERIHLQIRPFSCDLCDYTSSRRDKLKDHQKKYHDERQSANIVMAYRPRKPRLAVINHTSNMIKEILKNENIIYNDKNYYSKNESTEKLPVNIVENFDSSSNRTNCADIPKFTIQFSNDDIVEAKEITKVSKNICDVSNIKNKENKSIASTSNDITNVAKNLIPNCVINGVNNCNDSSQINNCIVECYEDPSSDTRINIDISNAFTKNCSFNLSSAPNCNNVIMTENNAKIASTSNFKVPENHLLNDVNNFNNLLLSAHSIQEKQFSSNKSDKDFNNLLNHLEDNQNKYCEKDISVNLKFKNDEIDLFASLKQERQLVKKRRVTVKTLLKSSKDQQEKSYKNNQVIASTNNSYKNHFSEVNLNYLLSSITLSPSLSTVSPNSSINSKVKELIDNKQKNDSSLSFKIDNANSLKFSYLTPNEVDSLNNVKFVTFSNSEKLLQNGIENESLLHKNNKIKKLKRNVKNSDRIESNSLHMYLDNKTIHSKDPNNSSIISNEIFFKNTSDIKYFKLNNNNLIFSLNSTGILNNDQNQVFLACQYTPSGTSEEDGFNLISPSSSLTSASNNAQQQPLS